MSFFVQQFCFRRYPVEKSTSYLDEETKNRVENTVEGKFDAPGRLARQVAVLDSMGLIGGRAQSRVPVLLIVRIVSFEPCDLAIAFKCKDMRGDAVQKPAVVADDYRAAREILERLLEAT